MTSETSLWLDELAIDLESISTLGWLERRSAI